MLTSAATTVHMVTLAEEMPVQEALDGVADLRAGGIHVGSIIVNARRPAWLPLDAELGPDQAPALAAALAAAGVPADGLEAISDGLLAEGRRIERLQLEAELVDRLGAADVPVVELPWLAEGIDTGSLPVLADRLRTCPGVALEAECAGNAR